MQQINGCGYLSWLWKARFHHGSTCWFLSLTLFFFLTPCLASFWCFHLPSSIETSLICKGIVHPTKKNLSFIHPHVVLNLYDFLWKIKKIFWDGSQWWPKWFGYQHSSKYLLLELVFLFAITTNGMILYLLLLSCRPTECWPLLGWFPLFIYYLEHILVDICPCHVHAGNEDIEIRRKFKDITRHPRDGTTASIIHHLPVFQHPINSYDEFLSSLLFFKTANICRKISRRATTVPVCLWPESPVCINTSGWC